MSTLEECGTCISAGTDIDDVPCCDCCYGGDPLGSSSFYEEDDELKDEAHDGE